MYNKISYNTQMAMYQPNAQNVPNWYKIIQKNINYPYGIILPKITENTRNGINYPKV
jgi:hypothetical protein